ncbi:leucyl aminopeptidase family protein [Georgenia faecalis]|uniref:leucyl aminopeptidase family protein n=1 Tax=Georgenia faecalis TaxID=2483799 RepID=UPI000FD982C2|nr:leucyl aminopeptidase family protein [Georgenia faecalis]
MAGTQAPHLSGLPEILLDRADGGGTDGTAVDAVVVAVAPATEGEELQPRPGTVDVATRYGVDLLDLAQREGLRGNAGDVATLDLPRPIAGHAAFGWEDLPRRLVLLGVGDAGASAMRRAGAALTRATAGLGTVVTTLGQSTDADGVRALVEGVLLAAYRPPRTATTPHQGKPPVERVVLLGREDEAWRTAVALARAGAEATVLARTLSATPSNVKNPAWMGEQAQALGAARPTVDVEVRDEEWLRRAGLECVLAVGAGSVTPPRFVTVTHTPATPAPGARTVVLVGKGITYDTGGISIKPRDAMIPMKTDMTGAAVVLATVLAAADLGLPHRVTAVLPLAENAMGAGSYRPGDVLRAVDGTTVEVTNTDAEGRLVLADAMAWAADTLAPDVLVDVATLTGAATLGLGRTHSALYSDDDALAAALAAAGEASGERAWRMPLVEEYRPSLASPVADVSHQSTDAHIGAGSVTAALFLQRFAHGVPWAHLDIAGPARSPKATHEIPEGATGYGARLLLRWLESLA